MRKAWLPVVLSIVFIVAAACSNNETKGKGSSDIPVEWVNAHIQKDQGKMVQLLQKEQTALDPEDEPDNSVVVENYRLTEWKANDERYFYEIVYEHPEEKSTKTERMEIVKTDNGWKRTQYGDVYNFDELVADLEPKVLRELHEQ
ncbi:hypothetical protein LCM00_21080 [Bacillus infantis]|uniref:hypothetical protein n=1 Tax=Bacillus infantis TaxID=324767 RepID=UPI001CD4DD6F|nr:hypothetical protein [Bacillus infantis]MCA1041996.1 hypothetical protein [Bacillus infantis]